MTSPLVCPLPSSTPQCPHGTFLPMINQVERRAVELLLVGEAPATVVIGGGDAARRLATADGKKTPLDRRKSLADKLKRGWTTLVRGV